MGKINSFP
uniref:Uncharacterized protein n=1 Tax=Rhizophora mucronata TaxID=61149 RepID=A0A2P2QHB2_RHIMU